MTHRIIIADDHLVVRAGLKGILTGNAGYEVVAEAEDGIQAEQLTRALAPDLLILDIGLPLRRGVAVCERLRADGIATPVLFFSMYPASQYRDAVRKMGGQGFVGKEAPATTLLKAVEQILVGGHYYSGESAGAELPAEVAEEALAEEAKTSDPFASLSPREKEVLDCLVSGQSLTNLARSMEVSLKTISTYRTRLLNKLGKNSNAELIAMAIQHRH